MSIPVPDACTLPTAAQPLRQAEFATLCSTAVRHQERIGPGQLRLTLSRDADLASAVRDLADREKECCSFFEFAVTETDGVVTLDIEVPAAQTAVLDGVSEFAARLARHRSV